jgi:hypothetical protein
MSSGIDKRWFVGGSLEIIPMEDTYLVDEVNHQNIIVVLSTANRKSVVPPPRAEFPIVGLPSRYLKV